ncbi:MAG: hypothetical protein AAB592_02045, partial [Patescibacteria group bacterium]
RRKMLTDELGDMWKHREKVALVSNLLGDYVAYSVRLTNLISRLKFTPDRKLGREAFLREGGDIYRIAPEDNNDMQISKAMLSRMFFTNIETPERYFTISEHAWGWLAGRDTDERPITMRDFHGRTYSVDKTWFLGLETSGDWAAKYLSAETMYMMTYQAGTRGFENDREIDTGVVSARLRKQLEMGLSAYFTRPDGNVQEMMKRNGTVFTGRLEKDLQTLYSALEKQLDGFIKAVSDFQKTNRSPEKLAEFIDDYEFPNSDVQNFIRIGAVIDYKNGGVAEAVREGGNERYHLRFTDEQADGIVRKIAELHKLDDEQLRKIRENLVAGVVVSHQDRPSGKERTGAAAFTTIALPGGFFLDIGAGGFKTPLTTVGGVGKKISVSEKVDITLRAGGGAPQGMPNAGGEVVATYHFDSVDASVAAGGSTLGWWAGGGIEKNAQYEYEKALNKTLVENHLLELEKLSPDSRYQEIQSHPEKYPELFHGIYCVESFPGNADFPSRVAMMDEIFHLYADVLKTEALGDSFPILRGINFRGGIVAGLPFIIGGVDFGIEHRDLVFRLARYEHADGYTQESI